MACFVPEWRPAPRRGLALRNYEKLWIHTEGKAEGGSSESSTLSPIAQPERGVHTEAALLLIHQGHFLNYFPIKRWRPDSWPHSHLPPHCNPQDRMLWTGSWWGWRVLNMSVLPSFLRRRKSTHQHLPTDLPAARAMRSIETFDPEKFQVPMCVTRCSLPAPAPPKLSAQKLPFQLFSAE